MMTVSRKLCINPDIGGNGTLIPVAAGFKAIARAAKASVKANAFVFISFRVANYDKRGCLIV